MSTSPNAATTFIPQQFDAASIRVALNPAEAAEQARTLAFDKGYNDGLEQARNDVLAATDEANHKVRRTLASLREAIDLFDNRETTALTHVEDAIIAASFEIARAMVQRELQLTTDPGAEAIARAMKLVPARTDVVAHLNPEDAATLNADTVPTNNRNLIIVPDDSVERGGCVIEAGQTNIDSQFTSIFANVRTALGLDDQRLTDDADGSVSPSSRTTASEAPLS